jgi:hypothetical protein
LKEAQPENSEEAPRVNGTKMNLEAAVEPDESQTTVSEHPPEVTVEDVTNCLEWYSEAQMTVTRTSIQPPPKKDKQQVPRSPCKQLVPALVLPCIPYGVQVESGFLGHINKLKYSYHDVADADKFTEFAKRIYLETVDINLVGELIDHPL